MTGNDPERRVGVPRALKRSQVVAEARTRQWGMAWVVLALAIGLHVVDEAVTDFLPLYNSLVTSLRTSYSWIPLPTFSFSVWITGLAAGVGFLLALSPLVFAGNLYLRPFAYFLGVLMAFNALAHLAGSLYLGEIAPGALSSPILLLAAVVLLVTTHRYRGAANDR